MVSLLLIVKENRFLFCKRRPNDEAYAGYWGLPGGTVEKHETPVEGMIREVKEELGIDINQFRLLDKYELKNNIMNVYVHDDTNFDETTIELNEEHTEYKFFTYYEVQKNSINFVPTNTQILLDYIRTQS